jgi:hypothetical protein
MKEISFSKSLEFFIMNNQPFTCSFCGSRCEQIGSFLHTNIKSIVEKCMNLNCSAVCYEQEDEEFLKLW